MSEKTIASRLRCYPLVNLNQLGGSFDARNSVDALTVPKTDSGGLALNAKTIEIMLSKELCKITP